jgi:hypothetical protein
MKTAGFAGEVDFWKNREAAHPYNYYIDTGSPVFDQPDWEGRGSGDLIVSAGELYKWELALRGSRVLSDRLRQKFFTPHAQLTNGWHYALGWFVIRTDRNTTEFYHGGSNVPRGFTASFSRYPEERATIIILANTMIDEIGFLRAVKDDIVNITFGKTVEMPPDFEKAELSRPENYEAFYQTDSGAKFVAGIVGGELMLGAVNQGAIDFLTSPDKETKEKLGDFNRQTQIFMEKTVRDASAVPALKITFDAFRQRNGEYRDFEVLGTVPISIRYNVSTSFVKIVRRGANVYSLTGGSFPALTPLKPQKANKFVAFYPLLKKTLQIDFAVDRNGKITGMNLKNENQTLSARKLPF